MTELLNFSVQFLHPYGEHFSKLESPFLQAIVLARNNEKQVQGIIIVINAFSESIVIRKELLALIDAMSGSEDDE